MIDKSLRGKVMEVTLFRSSVVPARFSDNNRNCYNDHKHTARQLATCKKQEDFGGAGFQGCFADLPTEFMLFRLGFRFAVQALSGLFPPILKAFPRQRCWLRAGKDPERLRFVLQKTAWKCQAEPSLRSTI